MSSAYGCTQEGVASAREYGLASDEGTLLAASARACAAAPGCAAAGRDHGLAGQARHLLGRLRGLAEKLTATGPLQQAHRLTFAAEAARADEAAGAPGPNPLPAWDAAVQAWDRLGQP